jgi:hypothetical protein
MPRGAGVETPVCRYKVRLRGLDRAVGQSTQVDFVAADRGFNPGPTLLPSRFSPTHVPRRAAGLPAGRSSTMSTQEESLTSAPVAPAARTQGEIYEGIAFTFCKAATIILLTQQFALPVAAGAAAIFYLLADRHGKKDTRCILKRPRLIAAFWGVIALASLFRIVYPMLHR